MSRAEQNSELLLRFSLKLWYTAYEVRAVQFRPFVYDAANHQVPVTVESMTPRDAATTTKNQGGRRIGPASISQKENLISMG